MQRPYLQRFLSGAAIPLYLLFFLFLGANRMVALAQSTLAIMGFLTNVWVQIGILIVIIAYVVALAYWPRSGEIGGAVSLRHGDLWNLFQQANSLVYGYRHLQNQLSGQSTMRRILDAPWDIRICSEPNRPDVTPADVLAITWFNSLYDHISDLKSFLENSSKLTRKRFGEIELLKCLEEKQYQGWDVILKHHRDKLRALL